ncbi:MAG: CAP domain-containing protein [Candidatus Promineifilaceae bacterium]|nr:CAP domain-containing protein [Candidatus Promineifilaceae bacterium]
MRDDIYILRSLYIKILLLLVLLLLSTGCDEDDLASIPSLGGASEIDGMAQQSDVNAETAESGDTAPKQSPTPTVITPPTDAAAAGTALPTQRGETTEQAVVAVPDPPLYMTELINEARAAEGLAPVIWDPVAAEVARQHARDMIERDYFGHRNLEGYGPDLRYGLAGGEHAVQENLYAFVRLGEGRLPFASWADLVQTAHHELMASPGHRQNILNPAHTHVGIGVVYDEEAGELRLAQEFTNQYVTLTEPLPAIVEPGDSFTLHGALEQEARDQRKVENLLLSLAHEPFPEPMTRESVGAEGTYVSRAEPLQTWRIEPTFERQITVNPELAPGLLHVRIFGDLAEGQALLMDRIIEIHGD